MAKIRRNRVIVPLSGGLDSAALLVWHLERGAQVYPMFLDYGHRAYANELAAARCIVKWARSRWLMCAPLEHRTLNLCGVTRGYQLGYKRSKSRNSPLHAYTPGRNVFIAVSAMLYAADARADEVSFALVKPRGGVEYPDCTNKFVSAARIMARSGSLGVSPAFTAPFKAKSKTEAARLLAKYGFDFSLLWTCSSGGKKSCGQCGSCVSLYFATTRAKVGSVSSLSRRLKQKGKKS